MNFCACWLNLFADLLRFLVLSLRSKTSLAARESPSAHGMGGTIEN